MIKEIKKYYCRNCGTNLRGKAIPQKQRKLFGATHFGREIGLYDWNTDRISSFKCPDCGYETQNRFASKSKEKAV